MASELSALLLAHPLALAVAVLADLVAGDPVYRCHPVRLMGSTLTALEKGLRRIGSDGYGGGVVLFILLAVIWTVGLSAFTVAAGLVASWLGWLVHAFVLYSLLALGDLLRHVWRVERALIRDDLPAARTAIGHLVGRDTSTHGCRRLPPRRHRESERKPDGRIHEPCVLVRGCRATRTRPLQGRQHDGFDGGLQDAALSPVRLVRCAARRCDELRAGAADMAAHGRLAAILPRFSGRKAIVVGFTQHAVLPGPNSGWSEAATAGALERRLVGPIWMQGRLVTDTWLGDAADPPVETHDDLQTRERARHDDRHDGCGPRVRPLFAFR